MSHSDLFRFPPLLACRPPRLLLERFLFRDLNHDSLEEEVEELEEEVVEVEEYPQTHQGQHIRQYDWGQNAVKK